MARTADDLVPLLAKLTRAEKVRLARIALSRAAADSSSDDGAAYVAMPPQAEEFAADEGEFLAWDAGGWDGIA